MQLSSCDVTLGNVLASRKGRTGGGGRVQHLAEVTWLLLGLAVETPWLAILSFPTNGLRKQSLAHVEPPFLAAKLFLSLYGWSLPDSYDY